MMIDFTLKKYQEFLGSLIANGYKFQTFESSLVKIEDRIIILRHDVDLLPQNSLATAKIENGLGIKGTYNFRIVPESFDEKIIQEIAELGHEIGYHYEELDTAYRQLKIKNSKLKIGKSNGTILQLNNDASTSLSMTKSQLNNDASTSLSMTKPQLNNDASTSLSRTIDLAYEMFKKNLEKMRSAAEIKTICMHGSPLSKFDNKEIWSKYGYKELGLFGEPYFDLDWNEFGYLTDTGRRWNGSDVSVRDKVESKFKFNFKSTKDIIVNIDRLPDHIMITVHPQRWTDSYFAWGKELVW